MTHLGVFRAWRRRQHKDPGGCFGLAGLPQQALPWDAGWHSFRLFAQVLSFLREALLKRGSLAELASLLHGCSSALRGRQERDRRSRHHNGP